MLNLSTVTEFQAALQQHGKLVVHFWAKWCEPCATLDQILEQLGKDTPSVACARVEAEEAAPELSELCGVTVVPLLLFFCGGKEVARVEGAEPASLHSKFVSLANTATPTAAGRTTTTPPAVAATPAVPLRQRLEALVAQRPVMLFMKGTPDEPRCGFSRKVVEAVKAAGAEDFGHFDILSDEQVRQGLKEFTQWPTYPQLYVNGEFLGGCDIVLEMAEAGELKEALKAT